MPALRYSKWDGTQEPFPVDPEDIFRAIADDLLEHGDVRAAIRDLLRRGLEADNGRTIVGADELRRRVRARRRALLEQYNLEHLFDELNDELDDILDLERDALQQQARDAASVLGRSTVHELRRNLVRDAPSPPGALERMWYDAAQAERRLDSLPDTFHGRLTELRKYSFANPEAQAAFDALVAGLQRRLLGRYFEEMRDRMADMPAEDRERMRQMLADLGSLVRRHLAGEPVEEEFARFKRTYPHMFAGSPDMTFEQFLATLVQQAAQLHALMESLSPDDLAELEGLLDWSFLDDDLREAMREFTELLMQLAPPSGGGAYGFQGAHPLSLDEALQTIEQLHALDQFESRLDRAVWRGLFDDLEASVAETALGEDGARLLRDLQNLARQLEAGRYVRRTPDGPQLTGRAVRRLGTQALEEIFAHVDKTLVGRHTGRSGREAGSPSGATHPYSFGQPLRLDVPRTVMNATQRTAGAKPLNLTPDDFEVQELEFQARCATVLLIDQSSSMERLGRFAAAKRVALALSELIRQRFPRDELHVVGFHTLGQEVPAVQLPTMREMPRQGVIWVNEKYTLTDVREHPEAVPMDFTNVQEGLRIARRILGRSRSRTKQVIMITDGQPTAFVDGTHLVLSFPEVEHPCAAALKEVRRCTRQHIRINTFMLREDYYLEAFVERLTEINRGRAFFTTPHTLGQAVMRDYVRGRAGRV